MKYTLEQLRENRKKNRQSIFRILYRRQISERITWFLANFTNFKANTISFFGILLGIASAISFYSGNLILGAVFYEFRLVMDDVDGELARLKNLSSSFGRFMDSYSGWMSNLFVPLGLCFGMFRSTGYIIFLYLCPLLLFVIYFHGAESVSVAVILGNRFREKIIEKSSKKSKPRGLIWMLIDKLKTFLSKQHMVEPLCLTNFVFLLFVIAPILEYFISGFLFIIIVFVIITLLLREIFYFFFYRSVLIRADKENIDKEDL